MAESGYERLKSAINDGRVEITFIDAPPRTVGSALFRSLSQFYDAEFYEAFHPNRGTFDEICNHIADTVANVKTAQDPKRILVKSLPRHFSAEDWPKWKEICSHFIYAARDPQLQMYSLLERNANDLHFKKKGAEGLTRDEVWGYADKVGEWLQNGGERVGEANRGSSSAEQLQIQGGFARAAWYDMDAHIRDAQQEIEKSGGKKSLSLVTGFLLRTDTENIMTELLERLHLPTDQSSLALACHAWNEKSKDSVYVPAMGDSAYTEPVRKASGFSLPLERTPRLEKFPANTFRSHIQGVALPIYGDFLANPYLLGRGTVKEKMRDLLAGTAEESQRLLDNNPVDVYSHIASLSVSKPTSSADGISAEFSEDLIRKGMLDKVRKHYQPYAASFDIIDAHAKERETHPRINATDMGIISPA